MKGASKSAVVTVDWPVVSMVLSSLGGVGMLEAACRDWEGEIGRVL